uniref:Uncharacterized protein n=1 Tax=Apteryx owenii TaxID=8824 RepID=A0A8B9QP11_APTOW
CGFFQRSRYDDSVPRYHAVRIRKEERQIKDGKCKDLETKQWITKWNENETLAAVWQPARPGSNPTNSTAPHLNS